MVALDVLENLSFLDGVPADYLKPLAAVATVVDVPANEIIFYEKQKSPNIYLVVEGLVALEIWAAGRGATRIQTVAPGRLLGWTPVLGQGFMTATARTIEPCRLVAINAMQVLETLRGEPSVRHGIHAPDRSGPFQAFGRHASASAGNCPRSPADDVGVSSASDSACPCGQNAAKCQKVISSTVQPCLHQTDGRGQPPRMLWCVSPTA